MAASRTTRLCADGIAAVSVLLLIGMVVEVVVISRNSSHVSAASAAEQLFSSGFTFALGFGAVGWLLARRVPENLVGWCFAVAGLTWVGTGVIGGWAELAETGRVALGSFARECAAINAFSWVITMPFSVQLPLLLLPNGRLLSRHWRPAVWLVGVGALTAITGFLTIAGRVDGTEPGVSLPNPTGVRALGAVPQILAVAGAAMLLVGILVGAAAVVVRFRRSTGVERQQLRWVAFGGCGMLCAPVLAFAPGIPDVVDSIGGTLAILAVPVCIGVAVLKYRLYDLGRLVSRTVSYAIVTALLVGVYVGLIAALTHVLPGRSAVGVAASTLAVAALIQPARRRVQAVVDRRFNRARYDAERTVRAFAGQLRDEVELDAVCADLVAVVQSTLHPSGLRLWLRTDPVAAPREAH